MLSAMGGLLGWWMAAWGVHLYAVAVTGPGLSGQISGTWFNGIVDYSMDYRVFGYLTGISMGTGLLFGLAPASRLSRLDVNAALKDGGRPAGGGGRGKHLSGLLVAAEMALAVVLLVGAGVMLRSFVNVFRADAGIRIRPSPDGSRQPAGCQVPRRRSTDVLLRPFESASGSGPRSGVHGHRFRSSSVGPGARCRTSLPVLRLSMNRAAPRCRA